MLSESRTADAGGGLNISWFKGRDYVYTRHFSVSKKDLMMHNVLEFEGVYRKAEVWINGKKTAFRPYGYTNFYVELDDCLREGDNTVEVIARNGDQPNSRWYSGSGIYRPVKWWRSPKKHIELNGVRIRTLRVNPAVIEISVRTSEPGPVTVQILDGETVTTEASFEGSTQITISDAKLWSVDTPSLYTAKVRFGEDTAVETFGIRTLQWGKDGFLVNGERVILRGACVHHDNGLLGAVCHPDAVERKLRILKENGYKKGAVAKLPEYSEQVPVTAEDKAIFDAACSSYQFPLGTPSTVGKRQTPESTDYKFTVNSSSPNGTASTSIIYVTVGKEQGAKPEFTEVVR